MKPIPTNIESTAYFSKDRKYRYMLSRFWDHSKPYVLFCMLNPSTADETKNDPTVERCQRRAEQMGFGGLVVVNIFAYRSTDPNALYDLDDPVGPENENTIMKFAKGATLIVCGWGKHGALKLQGSRIIGKMLSHGLNPHVLKINKDGSPAHPLYIGYKVKPVSLSRKEPFKGFEQKWVAKNV